MISRFLISAIAGLAFGVPSARAEQDVDKTPNWKRAPSKQDFLSVFPTAALQAGKGGKATPWHQDGHYWPIRPLETVTAWIAIDNVNAENSCLRVIPGTHRDRVSYSHDNDNSDKIILNQVLKPEHLQSAPPRDIELEPGHFSIHDVYLIHGAEPNNSGKRRAGMVFRYMPATSHFDRELAAQQVRDMGVLDLTKRKLHLVRGVDRSGRNDIYRGA